MNYKPIQSTISESDSGAYKVRWRAKNSNWQKTFKRKVDAIIFQGELLKSNIVRHESSKVNFDQFAEIWLERHCKIEVEESTAKGYEQYLRGSVTAAHQNIREISRPMMAVLCNWLSNLPAGS